VGRALNGRKDTPGRVSVKPAPTYPGPGTQGNRNRGGKRASIADWGGFPGISPLFGCILARSLYNAGFRSIPAGS
jgi:hypothetical protein